MRRLRKLGGALLVTYAVSATVALVAWGVSYGVRGIPVVHDADTLAITGVISVIVAAVVGAAVLSWAYDTETEEEKQGGRD